MSEIALVLHINVNTTSHWAKTYMHLMLDNSKLYCWS